MARRRDPAEIERQKLARQRFRSLIRSVMYNRIWLTDEEDQKKILLNVKRNVAMLVRRRHKIGVLTMAEKGLIRTPHSLRTIEDRKKLLKLITGLKCFANLSPQVRVRLIPKIKFLYLGAGRKIIKEGGSADTVYFILYGEVEASRRVFDPLKGDYIDKIEFIYSAGDCIGEIELIEECLRKHTYTATTDVELLVVFGHDFDEVLRAVMTKQWIEKKTAIRTLGYFDHFTEEQMISANKLSALKEFDALETIYHEDLGEDSYSYFVLSGECMILQSLQLKVTKKRFFKTYQLLDIPKNKNKDSSTPLQTKDMMTLIKENENALKKSFDINVDLDSDEDDDNELSRIKQALRTMDIKTIETTCSAWMEKKPVLEENQSIENLDKVESDKKESDLSMLDIECLVTRESEDFEGIEDHSSTALIQPITVEDIHPISNEDEAKNKDGVERGTSKNMENMENMDLKTNLATTQYENEEKDNGKTNERKEMVFEFEEMRKASDDSNMSRQFLPKNSSFTGSLLKADHVNIETRFIDVGSLTFGAIFGLGEKFEDRVIMARTKVQCLMLPRFWLFEKEQNPGRLWQRRRFAVDTGIPSRLQLYNDFLNTRKWRKYKNDFISSILDPKSIQNPTHYQDIPIMFHIINPVEE